MAIKMDGNTITALKLKASNGTEVVKQLIEEGGELPTLTNPASASDILSGKEAIDGNGAKLTGTCTYDADTSDADAVASDIAQGKTAYVNGSKITGTATGGGTVEPFDTYEFNIPNTITSSDEEGTNVRTLATFTPHQAFTDKLNEYKDMTFGAYGKDGYARILCIVVPKNPDAVIAETPNGNTFLRRDTEIFAKAGSLTAPRCYKVWRIKYNGTHDFLGGFSTSNDRDGIYPDLDSNNLYLLTQLNTNSIGRILAGDYVAKFYDITWQVS